MNKKFKRAIFYISFDILTKLENPETKEDEKIREAFTKFMSDVVILDTQSLYHRRGIKYIAFSDKFREVPDGEEYPEISIDCITQDGLTEKYYDFKFKYLDANPRNKEKIN